MNTHTFDNHSVTCPICQRTGNLKPVKLSCGLFTCPYCQERLVVCRAGHYVRDPFCYRQIAIASALRRQSRPFARILRDLGILKRPAAILALVSALAFGVTVVTLQSLKDGEKDSRVNIERINESVDPPAHE